MAQGPAFPLKVTGSGFMETPSSIYFGTNALRTLRLSDSILTATVPASMIAAPGSVQITVGSPDSGHGSSSALTFQILPAAPSVIPSADVLGPNGTRQFAVMGFDNESAVSWSVAEGSAGGTITSGFYTAPAEKGTFHVIASAVSDPTVSATATVTVVGSGFTPSGDMHVARTGHTATLLRDGKVLVVGGAWDDTAELFDPTSAAFSFAGSLVTGRSRASATLLSDGRVLIAGGLGLTAGPNGSLPVLDTAELYDPSTGKFSATGNLQQARWNHVATLLNDGHVLITGGSKDAMCFTASAELFDPATGMFSLAGLMLSERDGHTATLLATGEVLIVGGANGCAPDSADDPPWDPLFAELYEPKSRGFQGGGNMSTTRIRHAAIRLGDGRVLVLGGIPTLQNIHEQPPNPSYAELYDPVLHTFSPVADITILQAGYTATLLNSGMLLIAGGANSTGKPIADVQLLDPGSGALSSTGNLGYARVGHTATLLQDGRVLVAGGTDANGKTLARAELYQ
jgi:hypothetical protein